MFSTNNKPLAGVRRRRRAGPHDRRAHAARAGGCVGQLLRQAPVPAPQHGENFDFCVTGLQTTKKKKKKKTVPQNERAAPEETVRLW